MDVFKKPYEISLWEDQVIWRRQKLNKCVQISESNYKTGKYYYKEGSVYKIDNAPWTENRDYYELAAIPQNGRQEDYILEGSSSDNIIIAPQTHNAWYTFSKTKDETQIKGKLYYIKEGNTYRSVGGNDSFDPQNWYEATLNPMVVIQYFQEVKLCVIGSDSMDSPARCVNPKFTQKLNGENTLTFDMYNRYWDDDFNDFVFNPFNGLMVNERKVKLRIGPETEDPNDENCEWFDFLIKSKQENSDSKVFSYTCKDQFVNELAKTGFELELDNELENNMGTINKLASYILEGSDWKVDEEDMVDLKQYREEPLYELTLSSSIEAYNIEKSTEKITINKDSVIYIFYSCINERKPEISFLYNNSIDFNTDEDGVILKSYTNYAISKVTYTEDGHPTFSSYQPSISNKYRGNRLVRQLQTKYDSTIDKYVGVYMKEGIEYYGYTQSEYITSGAILNYVANPNCFTSTSGWGTDANSLDYQLTSVKNSNNLYDSYLYFTNKSKAWVYNGGIGGNCSQIKEFVEGQKYVVRIKYKTYNESNRKYQYETTLPNVTICEYDYDSNKKYVIPKTGTNKIFDFAGGRVQFNNSEQLVYSEQKLIPNEIDSEGNYTTPDTNYVYGIASCNRSISESKMSDWDFKIGLFFQFPTANVTYYIEDVQVFPYETYQENSKTYLCVPEGKFFSETKTKYIYYKPDSSMTSIKDLEPSYSDYINDTKYVQKYGVGENLENASEFSKVRSISGKESNRFNLIQQLCETFECWCRFRVERDKSTGQIYYGKDFEKTDEEALRQQKFISFYETTDTPHQLGFSYGLNSKSIQRSVESTAIVSKMIVKDNSNEFAPNGFCSISRASENYTGENFILNFDHYISQGLLNRNTVNGDLYTDSGGYLGYYKRLKKLNAERDKKIDIQAGLLSDISKYDAAYTTYKTSYDKAVEEQLLVEEDIQAYLGKTITDFSTNIPKILDGTHNKITKYQNDSQLSQYWTKWCRCANILHTHKIKYETAETNLTKVKNNYKDIEKFLSELAIQKRALNLQFYKKYSRFIQEGSWIKDDYTDPNLYYLDAESTLHTSAQPKVSYTINVIDVSPLGNSPENGEDYQNFSLYEFKIGDRSYIEDVEYFGWSKTNDTIPYREEIIVSEIVLELDAPEKTQIKVQNYKTQFEDLFQRITANTQQAEYHTGEYARAASIVEPDGTISIVTLQNSIENNSLTLSNARDQSVDIDDYGITTTSLSNPSEMVRIVSGGIFLSTDGGASWKTGITGRGISASYLTSGQLNTNRIYIMNGNNTAFRWDQRGLAAYYKEGNADEESGCYDPYRFVRFDHNGIYGIHANENWVGTLENIHNDANFALTWQGFSLKNEDGSVRISSDSDIQVLSGQNERIKIGRIGITNNPNTGQEEVTYGIRIKNSNNYTVMETGDDGELWLRKALRVGSVDTSTVKIGYLDEHDRGVHEVIHAGDSADSGEGAKSFIVYEDGTMRASGVRIEGEIHATGGTIGNLDIESIPAIGYEVMITSNRGLVIRDGGAIELSATLYYNGEEIEQIEGKSIAYQWYSNGVEIQNENKKILSLSNFTFGEDSYKQFSCVITVG